VGWLVRSSVRRPLLVGVLAVVAALAGVFSARRMPVDLFPNVNVPLVNVISHYPGATAEDLELLVVRPMEVELQGIPGVRRVAASSSQGVARVTVEFTAATSIVDARHAVQSKLARLRAVFPREVEPQIENIGTTLQEVSGYVVYGGADPVTLRNAVRHDLATRLAAVPGVERVDVLGGARRSFEVTVDVEALGKAGVTVPHVVESLDRGNRTSVAGYVERGSRDYLVRGDARLTGVEDVRETPIRAGPEPVLIRDVATVTEGRVPQHYAIRGDARPAVAFVIRKQPGANTISVVQDADAALAELASLLPPGSTLRKYYDQAEIIREARDAILIDTLVGALLAVLVLWFFLGALRSTLIVALTIPLTLLATVCFMHLLGLGFNTVTMTALTLSIGMIVDDAIVVAECVFRHRAGGGDAEDASVRGAEEVAVADAAGTFTTVVAFLPLVLVSGLAALFMQPFGLAISLALLVSLLLSLTLVPSLLARTEISSPPADSAGVRLLAAWDRGLQATLAWALKRKRSVAGLTLLTLALAGLSPLLGEIRILPPVDEGTILVEYILPPGTSLAESDRFGEVLDRAALREPGVACVYRRTGSPESGFQEEGVNRGEILIKLEAKASRTRSLDEIMASIKRSYSQTQGAVFLFVQPTQEKIEESFHGLPAIFGVTVFGDDVEELIRISNDVERIMKDDPEVFYVVNNTKVTAPELVVQVRRPRLALHGVSADVVLKTLEAAHFGVEATRVVRTREDVSVRIRIKAGESGSGLDRIRNLLVPTATELVPLNDLASIEVRHRPASITRLNGQRQVTVVAEVEGNIPAVVDRLRKRFDDLSMPPGYSIDFTGQYKVIVETVIELIFVILAAVVLIYLVLALQLGSWRAPLAILATIPVSLVGALLALLATRQGLDISVGLGAVTLVGIAVNNAIVLLDLANQQAASGEPVDTALAAAASTRLRPIVLTTLTTVAALLPAILSPGVGSEVFRPFAITVVGGLLTGTVATLVIVPTFMSALSPATTSE